MEGTLNAVTGFSNKIGSAVAVFIVGVLLTAAGYDGALGVNEAAFAKAMIIFLVGGVPIIASIVLWIALSLQDVFGFATPQAIYKWQHGTAMPTIDNLVVLAAFLQVEIDDILVVDAAIQVQISA